MALFKAVQKIHFLASPQIAKKGGGCGRKHFSCYTHKL